jgi:hypothetical protein
LLYQSERLGGAKRASVPLDDVELRRIPRVRGVNSALLAFSFLLSRSLFLAELALDLKCDAFPRQERGGSSFRTSMVVATCNRRRIRGGRMIRAAAVRRARALG